MSSDRPSRKRKTKTDDATLDDMGNTISTAGHRIAKIFRREVKTEEEKSSDKTDEVRTEAVLDQGEETPEIADEAKAVVDKKPSPSKAVKKEEEPSDDIVVDDDEVKTATSIDDDAPPPLERQDDAPTEQLPLDDTPESSPSSTPEKKKKKEESDDDIEVEKVVPKKQTSSSSLKTKKPKTIADMGYHFNEEGKLRSIEGDNVFKFTTQKEYEQLGDLIGDRVYELMVEEGLERKYFEVGRNRRFYFASPDYKEKARVLVLIHGSGVVKAGQWARKLIINESLDRGTQLEYIRRALALDWGVVVLNYNEKCVGQENRCHAPDAHGVEEWKHAFRRLRTEIVVVAHSYGGSVISEAAKQMSRIGDDRLLCVALTDSWFSEGRDVFAINWNTMKKKLYLSGGTYQMYSGDDTHEGTSAACINAVFALLEAVNQDTGEEEFFDLLEISEKIVLGEFAERMRKKREEKGETASTKSLELVGGEKENNKEKKGEKAAKGDEKENGDKTDEEEEKKKEEDTVARMSRGDSQEKGEAAKEEDEKENGEDEEAKGDEKKSKKEARAAEVKKDEDEKMEECEEANKTLEVTLEDEEAAPERNHPDDKTDDSDEGVEKDAATPEKSDNE